MPHNVPTLVTTFGGQLLAQLRSSYDWDARLVGGAVRDTLLGQLVTDWDFVIPAAPKLLHKALQSIIGDGRVQTIGLQHGVVSAKWQGHHITMAACRSDVGATNQRYAVVEFGSDWQADATRRDFTCNAIYFDGTQLWDPFEGVADLGKRLVRFIGDPHVRIGQDILRFWRFFRFWAHVGHGQDVDLSQHVGQLKQLSRERTYQEWRLLMQGAHRDEPLQELKRIGALDENGQPSYVV